MEKRIIGQTTNSNVVVGATLKDPNAYIIRVNTSLDQDTNLMRLPIQGTDMVIDWGDGTIETVTQTATPSAANLIVHDYKGETVRFIKITGGLQRVYFKVATTDRNKLTDIENWGNIQWTSMTEAYLGCSFLRNINTTAAPNLSLITSLNSTFSESGLRTPDLSNWDVSGINSFYSTFASARSFNSDLSSWDFSNATTLYRFLDGCSVFNQDVTGFDVSGATDLAYVFRGVPINQNIGGWQLNTGLTTLHEIFARSGMDTANYTDTIVGWANQVYNNGAFPRNINMSQQLTNTFDAARSGGANFANAGAARTFLTTAVASGGAGWTINGDTVI